MKYLRSGETIGETITVPMGDDQAPYRISVLQREGLGIGDEVILEVPGSTEVCTLIGGSELELTIEDGFGALHAIDLKTGERDARFLEPGVETFVPSDNIVYWYDNLDPDSTLIVRDHCYDFDAANEPRLQDVAESLVRLFQQ